jgi:signal transduction histidine kinase/ActR/RegA family two-component response regulator
VGVVRRSYAVAIVAVAGATLVVAGLRSVGPDVGPPLFLAAVVIAAWYGGRRPGLVATVLSLVVSELILDRPSPPRAVIVAGVGVLIVTLLARAREAQERAEALARTREDLVRQEQAARADAETASRSKDEFLAVLSHELRTPLNALMGWIWWLRRGALDADRQERAMETIERSTASLAQLVEDVLDLSRIITGKLRLSVRDVEPASVVSAAVESARAVAAAKSIALGVVVDRSVGAVRADPERLQQIVGGLLSNAIKVTPENGRVDLVLRRASSDVVIEVRDSGPGRVPMSGLGLSIVHHLVDLHAGTIRAEEGGDDAGVVFTVTLPLGGASPTAAAGTAVSRAPRLDHLNILVVEDDVDARLWLKDSLESLGAVISIATSVQEAVETFERQSPHVLVCDIRLPDGDGYALLQRVRGVDAARGRHTPAIAVTAYPRVEDRARALEAGFATHVSKPVTPDHLASVIAAVAGRGASTS